MDSTDTNDIASSNTRIDTRIDNPLLPVSKNTNNDKNIKESGSNNTILMTGDHTNNGLYQIGPYNQTIFQIHDGIKHTWSNLLNDVLDHKFETNTFTKEHRLFYIGITFVIIVLIMCLYDTLVYTDK